MIENYNIKLCNLKNGQIIEKTLMVDLETFTIKEKDSKNTFLGTDFYESFNNFNANKQKHGWIPLCNGARIDVLISGFLAESNDCYSVYLGEETDANGIMVLAEIFGETNKEKVGTIDQQQEYKKKNLERELEKSRIYKAKQKTMPNDTRHLGCLIGLACGDAIGTTVEFKSRGSFTPVTDMIGGGIYNLKPGQWTDDTSMALCLAKSLTRKLTINEESFDPKDQMDRYIDWRDNGYMSSTGKCFDIGNTVSAALRNYEQTREPYSGSEAPRSAGNGSLMRLASIAMFYHNSAEDTAKYAELSSKTTHGAVEAVDACHLFSLMLHNALKGKTKDQVLFETETYRELTPTIENIQKGSYKDKNIDDIKGSGYVIESLEAALWCFYKASTFEESVLKAVNLGDDADTTAAICGQLAGAYYGLEPFPRGWLFLLSKRKLIIETSRELYQLSP